MKKILAIVVLFMANLIHAQETVHSVVVEVKEISWYKEQLNLWKEETQKNDQNGEAWYNYYSATRALSYLSETEEEKMEYKRIGKEVVDQALKAVPNSFEANHIAYWHVGIGNGGDEYLLKAYEIAPDDPRVYDDMMIYYEVHRDKSNFKAVTKKIYEQGQLPGDLLNWGYNVLAELEPGAVVFTAGDNDTYALWVVQGALDFRPDVTVINTYLIQLDDYRSSVDGDLGIDHLKEVDPENLRPMFLHFLDNSKSIPAYISATAFGQFSGMEEINENLYVNGLTYRFLKGDFDNLSVIRRNYEKRYKLDYLDIRFHRTGQYRHLESLDGTYISSMLKLYSHYKVVEDHENMEKIEALIKTISKRLGQEEEVGKMLKGC